LQTRGLDSSLPTVTATNAMLRRVFHTSPQRHAIKICKRWCRLTWGTGKPLSHSACINANSFNAANLRGRCDERLSSLRRAVGAGCNNVWRTNNWQPGSCRPYHTHILTVKPAPARGYTWRACLSQNAHSMRHLKRFV